MKTVLVCGSSGFIGGHLVKRLREEGHYVIGADIEAPPYTEPHKFYQWDLRIQNLVEGIFHENKIHEVYQLAADMGGAGYVFTGEHDADIMHNSAQINLNIAKMCVLHKVEKVFYSSSACMYPQEIQSEEGQRDEGVNITYGNWQGFTDRNLFRLSEDMAYPANPDSEYGWEKLFSERLFLAYARNYGLNVRIARFHNIFGPEGTYKGGKEKAPAAICRKIAQPLRQWDESDERDFEYIELWGDGEQTRSFLYIDECIEGVRRLMESDFIGPVNIGSDEMVSINELAKMTMNIAGKELSIKHIPGPTGVRGRNSDNTLIYEKLGWKPSQTLYEGLKKTYEWINKQVNG